MGDGLASFLLNLGDNCGGRSVTAATAVAAYAGVVNYHGGALCGQLQAVGAAKTPPTSSDQNDAAVEWTHAGISLEAQNSSVMSFRRCE
ncbi:hypothetical protein MYCO108962_01055 [Mycobacterium colombiense]|uniref:Uncharacterized protein n=1 Tax=Mycobacterium colombiense CECT 3035 TaxID=1041522 RepID=J5EJC6_9MYCO|nr:hypothetical protein MCOL_V205000 [Mycobacterium colombiense CECT 3035]